MNVNEVFVDLRRYISYVGVYILNSYLKIVLVLNCLIFCNKKLKLFQNDSMKVNKMLHLMIRLKAKYQFYRKILLKICPLRGHILIARSSLRSQAWARIGRAIWSSRFALRSFWTSRFALGLVLFAYI